MDNTNDFLTSRCPHFWSMALAFVSFGLIWVGGLVTTTDAGMAVPDWPNTFNYNMFAYPVYDWFFGPWDLFVEHGHRLLGTLAGILAIAVVIATFISDRRSAMKLYSIGLLLLVIGQGVLGGTRVLADERVLAKVHGCVGPLFFMLVVGFCVLNSRWYCQLKSTENLAAGTTEKHLRPWFAGWVLTLCYLQLVVGSFVRHIGVDASPKGFKHLVYTHIALAIIIFFATIYYQLRTRGERGNYVGLTWPIRLLFLSIIVQILLGLTSWVLKYGIPVWADRWHWTAQYIIPEKTFVQTTLVTAHMAMGSLLLALWTMQMVRAWCVNSTSKELRSDILTDAKALKIR